MTPPWYKETLRKITRPHQRVWLAAVASCAFFALLGGRQIGKDRIIGGVKVSSDVVFAPGTEWHCLSASQRHAQDLMREIKRHVRLWLKLAAANGAIVPTIEVDNVGELRMSNGSRVVSHAATARSAQGCRGSVLLNEVGIMPRAEEIYETTYSIVTGQLDQGRTAKLIMMGNASERGSFWHSWWTGQRSTGFRKLTTTWEQAFRSLWRAAGWDEARIDKWVDVRRKERIQQIGSNAFGQWYDCRWRAAEDTFFGGGLLERASVDVGAELAAGRLALDDVRARQWLGYDVARRVHLSAVAQMVEGVRGWYTLPVMTMRDKALAAQRADVRRLAHQRSCAGVVMDSTGLGIGQHEELNAMLATRVHGVNFSVGTKLDLFNTLKDGLESGRIFLPLGDTDLRMELEAVEAVYSGGRTRVVLPEDGGGHCDRAVAVALASFGALGRLDASRASAAFEEMYGIS